MFAAGIAAIVGLILLSSGKAQAADKLGKIVKGKHGKAVVNFTLEQTLVKTTKAGKNIYRVDVVETPQELADYILGNAGLEMGGDFMSKEWEIPSIAVWKCA